MIYDFSDTFIGSDYLSRPKYYKTDLLLEFLSGLLVMRSNFKPNDAGIEKYNREIAAVKEVLTMQTASGYTH